MSLSEAPHTFSRKEWDKTVKLTHKTFDELGTVKQEKIIEKRTLKHADPVSRPTSINTQ